MRQKRHLGVVSFAGKDITVALTSVVKKTPFKEFCELSVQTRGCARGAARPSILRSVSSCAQAVVLDKDVVRRALDGQIDGQRGWWLVSGDGAVSLPGKISRWL